LGYMLVVGRLVGMGLRLVDREIGCFQDMLVDRGMHYLVDMVLHQVAGMERHLQVDKAYHLLVGTVLLHHLVGMGRRC